MIGPVLQLWDGYPHTNPESAADVRRVQVLLRRSGFEVMTDGRFGPLTQAAVETFQRSQGLAVDGIVGRQTWASLQGEAATVPGDQDFYTTLPLRNASLLLDLSASEPYRESIIAAALAASVPVAVVWGIGSRESRWGRALSPPGPAGTGDTIVRSTARPFRPGWLPPDGGGFGRGLMQIDFDAHPFARTGNWRDPIQNIRYGGEVLQGAMRFMARRGLRGRAQLRAAVAAYNCGPGNVAKALDRGLDVDRFTHGRDYSRDVLNRAGWAQLHGW